MFQTPRIARQVTVIETLRVAVIGVCDGPTVGLVGAAAAAIQKARAIAQRGKNPVVDCASRSRSPAPRN